MFTNEKKKYLQVIHHPVQVHIVPVTVRLDHSLNRIIMAKELLPVRINISQVAVLQANRVLEIHMCQATMGQPIWIKMHTVPCTDPAMVIIIIIIHIIIRVKSTIHTQINNTMDLEHHSYHSHQFRARLNLINIWIHCNNNITSECYFAIGWTVICVVTFCLEETIFFFSLDFIWFFFCIKWYKAFNEIKIETHK